jgi:hypothetical protein
MCAVSGLKRRCKSGLQEVSPYTLPLLCFVYHIKAAEPSGSDKNED